MKNKFTRFTSNYFEDLLISNSPVTDCVSFPAFTSLICIPTGAANPTVELKLCTITAVIKKHKSIIRIKEKSMIK